MKNCHLRCDDYQEPHWEIKISSIVDLHNVYNVNSCHRCGSSTCKDSDENVLFQIEGSRIQAKLKSGLG